jgi:erythromycin esterase-like protein
MTTRPSKLKQKLSYEVDNLSWYHTEDMRDMTPDMETIYVWAIKNAPIRKLREWKKEFKENRKREQEEQE